MVTRSGDPGGGERTTGQPPRDERDEGPKLTGAELMNEALSPVWSELSELLEQFRNSIIGAAEAYLKLSDVEDSHGQSSKKELEDLRFFLDTVLGNPKGTEGLEIMIKIAFEYIQRLGINDRRSRQLADLVVYLVVYIANKLRKAVDNIVFNKPQLSYETKKEFLEGLILYIVKLILSFGPNDSEFRGRKSGKYINHPNNDLCEVLDLAAYIFLRKEEERAKSLNNPLELIGPISSLLEMTKELRPDELGPIYSKILVLTSVMINELLVMKNIDRDNIDINSIKQLIINWCINYFAKHEDTFDQFVNQLLNYIPPHLGLKETLSQILTDLASETGDTKYSNMASRLNRNTGLEKRIEGLQVEIAELRIKNLDLKERIAELEERIAGLERMVQRLLKQTGSQT
jgi:hypothetical protein